MVSNIDPIAGQSLVTARRNGRLAVFLVAALTVPWFGPTVVQADGDGSTPTTDPSDTTVPSTVATTVPPASAVAESAASQPARPKVRIAVVRVILAEQTAYAYDGTGRLVATLPVSTGLGNSTPVGSFKIFSRTPRTFYRPDPSEKMDWMVRFTKSKRGNNIGFHSIPYRTTKSGRQLLPTPIGKAPSSHGCIRMRNDDARWLYHNVSIGTRVIVQRTAV